MKKFRVFRDKLFAMINLLLADEFFISTWEQTKGTKYFVEMRGSFKVEETLKTNILQELNIELLNHHEAKQIQANEEEIKKFSKGN